ncbi:MAG: proton-conducting transporter membrane subunit [Chloroflexota bacterium]
MASCLRPAKAVFNGVYVQTVLGLSDLLFMAIALPTILFAPDYLEPRGLPLGEFVATLLFAISGAMLLAAGRDIPILFLGLELLVLPGYLLVALLGVDGLSTEGAIKYFLLGSFSSAVAVRPWRSCSATPAPRTSSASASTGLGGQRLHAAADRAGPRPRADHDGRRLQDAAVPFHYWTPDAYRGSPTPVTGYLSTGPKVAAFSLVLPLFVNALGPLKNDWWPLIGVLAAITMTVGNLAARSAVDNIKRMLAYSTSRAHRLHHGRGLAVFGGVSDPAVAEAGVQAVLFYLTAYVHEPGRVRVAAAQRRPGVTSQISTFAGLGRRAPLLADAHPTLLSPSSASRPRPASGQGDEYRLGHRGWRLVHGPRGHYDDRDQRRRGLLLPMCRRDDVHA